MAERPIYRKQPHQAKPAAPPQGKPQEKPQGRPKGRYDADADPALQFPSLKLNEPFQFDGALARRLFRREVNPKEAFTVGDASGVFYRASLKEIGPNGGVAVPYEKMAVSPEPTIELTLACAVLGRQRMIFVAQKATELGVTRIVPLLTERSVPPRDLEHEKAHAWPGQLVRAAKQCRRSSLPQLLPPTAFDEFLASPAAQADLALCLDDIAGSAPPKVETPKKVLLLVGPEGGFSHDERKKLEGKVHPWILGGRILRAETAVLAGLAAVQLKWGDFKA